MKTLFYRFALELVSRISHVLSTPGGNALLGGRGGEGRETFSKIASALSDFNFFNVPTNPNYEIESWRQDVTGLLKEIGAHLKDKETK